MPPPPARPDRLTLLLVALSLLAAGIALAREATWGPALHGDPVNYVAVARHLLEGEGFTGYAGGPFAGWAPLWPLLLAGTSLSLADPLDVAGPLNAAFLALAVFAAGSWLRRRLRSAFLLVWGWLALALSVPLIEVGSSGLSEPAFILFATLALGQTDRFLEEGRRATLAQAAIFTALACLTRYIGGALILVVAALLLLQRGAAPAERARRLALFGAISALPVGLWMLRNLLLTGELTGERALRTLALPDVLGQMLAVPRGWIAPVARLDFADPLGWILSAATLLLLIAVAVALALARWRGRAPGGSAVALCGAFAFVYAAIVVAGSAGPLTPEPPNDRYLSPLYVPLLLLLLLALDGLRDSGRSRPAPAFLNALPLPRVAVPERWRVPAVAAGAALCLWVALMLPLTVRGIVQANNGDFYLGAADARWVNSPTLRLAREAADGGPVLSTDAALLYLHAGIGKDANAFLPDDAGELEGAIARAAPGTLVVWIDKPWRDPPLPYGPADLRAMPALEPLGAFADGAVFRVIAAPAR